MRGPGALGMSAVELCGRIEVPVSRITEMRNGRRAATGETALRPGRFFGTSGEFWLNLQKLYELRQAEERMGAAITRLPSPSRWRCGFRVCTQGKHQWDPRLRPVRHRGFQECVSDLQTYARTHRCTTPHRRNRGVHDSSRSSSSSSSSSSGGSIPVSTVKVLP